jgi:hypothetical protein
MIFGGVLLTGCVVFSVGASNSTKEFFAILPVALGILGASTLVGGFFGLLFGMPRALEQTDGAGSKAHFSMNSNLLKVSDWVTTVLVGLSLVNLREIPSGLNRLGSWAAPALGDEPGSKSMAVFLTIAGSIAGFLLMYLWTTVTLRGHLEDAARDIEAAGQDLAGRVARGELAGVDLQNQLKGQPIEVLEQIQKASSTVPPILSELAQEEQARRSATPIDNA